MSRRILEYERPDLVGISAMTETYTNGARGRGDGQGERIRRRVVVMGGAHPTILPEEVLAEDAVDFVVVGDGERTIVELVAVARAATGPRSRTSSGSATRRPSRA